MGLWLSLAFARRRVFILPDQEYRCVVDDSSAGEYSFHHDRAAVVLESQSSGYNDNARPEND